MKQMHRLLSRSQFVTGIVGSRRWSSRLARTCPPSPPERRRLPSRLRSPQRAPRPPPTAPCSRLAAARVHLGRRQRRQTLATQLGVKAEDVKVVSSGQVDWPNGCLGVQKPGIMCTDAIVPGYQVMLEVNGKQYEVRTDLSGQQVVVWRRKAPAGRACPKLRYVPASGRPSTSASNWASCGSFRPSKVEWPDACLGVPDPAELCAPDGHAGLPGDGRDKRTAVRVSHRRDRAEHPPRATAAPASNVSRRSHGGS